MNKDIPKQELTDLMEEYIADQLCLSFPVS
jgi:hypothetical protein